MNEYTELIKSVSVSFILRVIGVIGSYFFTIYIARNYGAYSNGLLALVHTILIISTIISRLGLDTASVRFISETYSNKEYYNLRIIYFLMLKIVFVSSIVCSFCLFYLSDTISLFFKEVKLNELAKISSFFILPLSILYINSESFRGMKKITYYLLFHNTTIPVLAFFILLIYNFFGFKSLEIPVYSYFTAIILLSIISILLWIKKLPSSKSLKNKNRYNWKRIIRISTPMLFTSSMFFILQWISILILGYYYNPIEVGIYDIILKISMVTSISLFAVNSISAPKFAEYYSKNDFIALNNTVNKSTKLIFWTTMPVICLILIFSENLLGLFGDEFIIGKTSLLVLLLGQFVNSISGSVGYLLLMTNRQKLFQNIILFSTIINIVLNFYLVPKYGILGAAISNTISLILWNMISMIFIYRKMGIRTLFKF